MTHRPLAYLAVHDERSRTAIAGALRGHGWAVAEHPTGFHLIQAIADVIEGARPRLQPGLIVVDAMSRGVAGTTIAAGLRELGVRIPIVLVTRPGDPVPIAADEAIHVCDAASAPRVVAELARPWLPARGRDSPVSPVRQERAIA